jgi:sugar phosphate isomerase/epimerase
MRIGIYTRTFTRPTLQATLDAVAAHGIRYVQFNLAGAGGESLPDHLDADLVARIRDEMKRREIAMAAVSGTFNMIDPDLRRRERGLRNLGTLIAACESLGTRIVTLSTGTRDPDNMWRGHPDNATPEAWRDLRAALSRVLPLAERHDVVLAFEPEVSNVVDSGRKGRRLLDEMGSTHLKVVIDGANVFHAGELARMREVLDETFALLGDDIVLAHAKDLSRDGEAGHEAAGQGVLDYEHYLALLHSAGYAGPLILHGLREDQVDQCVAFLKARLAGLPAT